jgi:hypothetical protein
MAKTEDKNLPEAGIFPIKTKSKPEKPYKSIEFSGYPFSLPKMTHFLKNGLKVCHFDAFSK